MVLLGKKLFITIWILLFTSILFMIIFVSAQVKNIEKQISYIERQTEIEQDNIRESESEWAFLTRPERIYGISKKLLPELKKITAKNIVNLETIPNSSKFVDIKTDSTKEYSFIRVSDE